MLTFSQYEHLVICMVDAMLSPETNVNEVVVLYKTSMCFIKLFISGVCVL
jgi:hypothetical protein